MKSILRVLSALIIAVPCGAGAVVPGTVGSNLTAFNNNMGAHNNNQWNTMTNSRNNNANTTTATADFGNCNALIMRCAQPKCAGCTTMEIATPIVAGCVQSTDACKQYGNDLIQYMAAQLVANATAKTSANEVAAANAAAAQSAQQLQQMQYQMQQMQADMAAQNAETVASLQAALAQQQEATAAAIAEATAAQAATLASVNTVVASSNYGADIVSSGATTAQIPDGLTAAQAAAAQNGVSADILAREQITGQIYTAIENAELAMKALYATMENAFTYAGCDTSGNNCAGPKRVKVFKDRALQFFEPYEDVLDEIYDALIMAQSVGVDITDIYMMLNGTCNAWAQYLCQPGQIMHYTSTNCVDGISTPESFRENGKWYNAPRGNQRCTVGQVVPMSDGGCQLTKMLTSDEEVQRNWLYPDAGDTGATVRVGCASEALDNSFLFRGRKKQASIDIDTLKRIIEQDAPSVYGMNRLSSSASTPEKNGLKFCTVSEESLQDLQKVASLKTLPNKKICVPEKELQTTLEYNGAVNTQTAENSNLSGTVALSHVCYSDASLKNTSMCKCVTGVTGATYWSDGTCVCPQDYKPTQNECVVRLDKPMSSYALNEFQQAHSIAKLEATAINQTISQMASGVQRMCESFKGAKWDDSKKSCDCSGVQLQRNKDECKKQFG